VRACIFDVDGTLINSEDIYTDIYNHILRSYNKPDYPWRIKALQQSRGTPGTLRLLEWAQLPLSVDEWKAKEKPYRNLFTESKLLPGVGNLLVDLSTGTKGDVKLALASSAGHALFDLKTSHLPEISEAFAEKSLHVFGDDPEMAQCSKKPSPDIFLLALKRLNTTLSSKGESPLRPDECLVFEDSIAGVEAGRRAGMRVVWVPHPGLAEVCQGREMDILMGKTEADGRVLDFSSAGEKEVSVTQKLGLESEDGWAELRASLEDFPYQKYGINLKL
jgi:pseudouridine-5'-monophosphatase